MQKSKYYCIFLSELNIWLGKQDPQIDCAKGGKNQERLISSLIGPPPAPYTLEMPTSSFLTSQAVPHDFAFTDAVPSV